MFEILKKNCSFFKLLSNCRRWIHGNSKVFSRKPAKLVATEKIETRILYNFNNCAFSQAFGGSGHTFWLSGLRNYWLCFCWFRYGYGRFFFSLILNIETARCRCNLVPIRIICPSVLQGHPHLSRHQQLPECQSKADGEKPVRRENH